MVAFIKGFHSTLYRALRLCVGTVRHSYTSYHRKKNSPPLVTEPGLLYYKKQDNEMPKITHTHTYTHMMIVIITERNAASSILSAR